jgi:tetratricopeptide (TPR) repeat protein
MIKNFLLSLFCLLLGWTSVAATTFDEANQKFKADDFAGAAAAYEEVLAQEGPRAALFYNLGNSYQQLKKYGPAILAYERALLITPRDSDLLANLARARKDASVNEEARTYQWLDDLLHFFSRNEWSWLVAGSALFLGGLALLCGMRKLPKGWPRTLTPILASIAGVTIIAGVVVLSLRHEESTRGVILSETAEVRLSPFEKAESIGKIGLGRLVQLGSKNGDFYYLEIPGTNKFGWLSNEDVAAVSGNF